MLGGLFTAGIQKHKRDMSSSNKLFVAAIDFGTTYSGYAFSNIANKEQVYTFNWMQGISQSPKTPTSILFNQTRNFHSFGYEAEEEYARRTRSGENRDWYFFKRFKMTLYKNSNLNESSKIKDFTGKEMQSIDVFSSGIRYLKEHLFDHFKERVSQLREDDIHWVLTVPAIWDEAAKKFMRKAAEKAGIPSTQLTLALEPESAALYCQMGELRSGLSPLQPGKKFLLLDCGGGTVDVTVHEIRQDNSFREIHRASGGPWGGIKVDDAFQEYLIEIFGIEAILELPKNDVMELDKSFEVLKRRVTNENKAYNIQIPLTLRQAAKPGILVAGRLRLSSEIAKGFFKKPINDICKHIKEILLSGHCFGLNTIILVGGFSESRLLQEEIQCKFQSVNISTPLEPGSAVVKGAVEFGHSPEKIRFRISPYTYGVGTANKFRYGVHPRSKLLEIEGEAYCDDIFGVHVTKDQIVETGTPISNKNYWPLYPHQTIISIQIVTSESPNPIYVDEPGCRIIGSFEIDIPNPYSGLDRSVNVKMIFSGTELKVEARDQHTKRLYNSSFKFE